MKTVFLDRDGVICEDREDYVKNWEEFVWIPGSKEAISKLTKAGFRIFIVTNQSCIGKGIVTLKAVEEIHRRMLQEIASSGGNIEKIYICPHRPDEGCSCRKPGRGLLLQVKKEVNVDLEDSYLVGDTIIDVEMGNSAGCRTIIVRTGRGLEKIEKSENSHIKPDYIVSNLREAADLILTRVSPARGEGKGEK